MRMHGGALRRLAWVWLVALAGLAGCADSGTTTICSDGLVCGNGDVCDEAHHGCAAPTQLGACEGKPQLAPCSYAGVPDGACDDGVCLPVECGDGIVGPGEACDDGNHMAGDGCSADCRSKDACGNGIVDVAVGEQCDDGLANSNTAPNRCRTDCQRHSCGDHVVDSGEACDDGNRVAGDGCNADCSSNETCGNWIVDPGEACDDGLANSDTVPNRCRTNCLRYFCGDHVVDAGEACDDGNHVAGDGCNADCSSNEACGNSIVDPGEACDDGLANSDTAPNACRTNCQRPFCGDFVADSGEACDDGVANSDAVPDACRNNCQRHFCGDHVVDSGEACDDGNHVAGDGCTADCRSNETCGNGIVDGSLGEQCDDGAANSDTGPAACRTDCQLHCGDHVVDPGEVCDDGNRVAGDGCSADCRSNETCGNGIVDVAVGEQCDDGNTQSNDGCAACHLEYLTWEDASAWTPASDSPPALEGVAMAYDAARGKVVMVGPSSNHLLLDTWEWDGTAWTNMTPATGSPPDGGTLVYDGVRGKVMLFRGQASSGGSPDTWEWDGSAWTNVAPATGSGLTLGGAAMAYDAARGKVVQFGGLIPQWLFGTPISDTWEWDGSAWTNVTPASGSPPALAGATMEYDAARGRVVMFGGRDSSGNMTAGTWEWDGTTWTNVTPASGSPPAGYRGDNAMAYDAARGKVVMVGSYGLGGGVLATWEWNGTTWTNMTPPSGSPPGRLSTRMAYDAARGEAVLFGGYVVTVVFYSGISFADTWLYHP